MSDDLDDGSDEVGGFQITEYLQRFRDAFLTYHLLLWLLLALFIPLGLVLIATSKPSYEATALVGPSESLDSLYSPDPLQSVTKHLHVGGLLGSQGGNDPFNEFTALLASNRLAVRLAAEPGLLQELFPGQWDAKAGRWYPRGGYLDDIRGMLHRPVKSAPDADDVARYLTGHLSSLVALDTGYATITFSFGDRAETEHILNLILRDADDIIREDKRRDVSARIAYLTHALNDLTLTEDRASVIDTLTSQQQEMTIIQSDHRFASTLIDPPYAPFRPTSPNPLVDMIVAVGLAGSTWISWIFYAKPDTQLYRVLQIFARGPRRGRRTQPVAEDERSGRREPVLSPR